MNTLFIPYKNTPENADMVARGEIELVRHGKTSPRLSKTELVEYEAAKARHYLITRGRYRAGSESLLKAYCGWCEASNQPPIIVYVARTRAVVDADLISMYPGSYLTSEAQLQVDAGVPNSPFVGATISLVCEWLGVAFSRRVPSTWLTQQPEALHRIISTTGDSCRKGHGLPG